MKMKQLIIACLLSNSLWAMDTSAKIKRPRHLADVIDTSGIELSSQLLQLNTHDSIVLAFNNSLIKSPNKTLTEYAYADTRIKQLNKTYDLDLHIADCYTPANKKKPGNGATILRGLKGLTKIRRCTQHPLREGVPYLSFDEWSALSNISPKLLNKIGIPQKPVTCMVEMRPTERYINAAKKLNLGNKFIAGFGVGFFGSGSILASAAPEAHVPLAQTVTAPEILKTTILCGLGVGCMHIVYTLAFGKGAELRKEWLPQEFKEKTIDFAQLTNKQL